MKKVTAFALILVLILVGTLTACGGTSSNNLNGESTKNGTNTNDKETSTNPKDVITIRVGFENTLDEPIGQALKKWQQLVEDKGDGSLKIELFANSALGTKSELIDMMIMGEPVVTIADGAFYADYGVNDMGIMYGPFFFDTWDDVWKLIESDWYKEQSDVLESKGLRLLASNWVYGERHLMTKNKVETPKDVVGMKIRVAATEIYMEGWNALGATATGIALGETYQALQTGVVEGVENPFTTLYGQSFQEVSKNLLLTGHIKNFTTWVCGADFFQTLTPEQQEFLTSTCEEAGLYNNEVQAENEEIYLQKLKDEGVIVTEMTEENLAAWKEKAQSFYEKGTQFGWSDGLYETTRKAMGK